MERIAKSTSGIRISTGFRQVAVQLQLLQPWRKPRPKPRTKGLEQSGIAYRSEGLLLVNSINGIATPRILDVLFMLKSSAQNRNCTKHATETSLATALE